MSAIVNPAGAAQFDALPPVGHIAYFAQQPSDPRWMKCDGAPHLRADYLGYEVMRPDPALIVFTQTIAALAGFPRPIYQGSGFSLLEIMDGSSYVLKRTTDFVTLTTVLTMPDWSGGAFRLTSGRIVLTIQSGRTTYTSDDDGLTWTARVDALPVGFPPNNYAKRAFEFGASFDRVSMPWPTTSKAIKTEDGVTWTEGISQSANPTEVYNQGWSTHICREIGYENNYVLFSGGFNDRVIESYIPNASGWDLGSFVGVGYLSRPGPQITRARPNQAEPVAYAGIQNFGLMVEGVSGVVRALPNRGLGDPNYPFEVAGTLAIMGVDPWGYNPIHCFGWLSPDKSSVETIPNTVAPSATNWFDPPIPPLTLPNGDVILPWTEWRGSGQGWLTFRRDPLKFNAPGLAPVGGAHPYVWTGV